MPAEVITIHKSQGGTYSEIVVHLSSKRNIKLQRSLLYVACSRATTAAGLYLVGNFEPPRPFGINDGVKLEMERLRTQSLLSTTYNHLIRRSSTTVYYHNVRSLNAHIEDIRQNQFICSADILCFVETWAFPGQDFPIDGYEVVLQLDGPSTNGSRPKNGIIIYSKKTGLLSATIVHNSSDNEHTFHFQDNLYFVVYRSPNCPIADFRNILLEAFYSSVEDNPYIVFVGDFNICRWRNCDILEKELNDWGVTSKLDADEFTRF